MVDIELEAGIGSQFSTSVKYSRVSDNVYQNNSVTSAYTMYFPLNYEVKNAQYNNLDLGVQIYTLSTYYSKESIFFARFPDPENPNNFMLKSFYR